MAHPFDEGLDNKEARKLWRQNGGLWESTKDNARAGWQATKDAVGKGANFAGEQAKKAANVVGKNPVVKAVPVTLKKTPHAAVVYEGVKSLGSAYDRVNNGGLDAIPDVGEASTIAGLSNMIYGSPDKIRGLFTGEKDDRFDRGANEFSQAIADRFIDVASFFGADDPRENIKQNAFIPGKVVDKSVAQTTTPSVPTKKKGLTQDQMKSRIEASAYANADPNKWGLNGKMPQGWGAVKLRNGKVVVTPPSESNFWGDPEAEKAWRAAEANRKMGLWSMEKTMDPTASLKERQLAADIYMYNGGGTGGASGLRGQLTPKDIHNNQLALDKEQRARYDKSYEIWKDIVDQSEPLQRQVVEGSNVLTKHNPANPYMLNYLRQDPNLQQLLLSTGISDPARGRAEASRIANNYIEALREIYNSSRGSNELPENMVYEDKASWELNLPEFFGGTTYIPEVFGDGTSYYLAVPGVGKLRLNGYPKLSAGAKAIIDGWANNTKAREQKGLSQGQ